MLLTLEELRELCDELVKNQHPAIEPDPEAMIAAYREAEQLAEHPEDEPAAIFLAMARRSRALGSIAKFAVPAAAHIAALKSGRYLSRADAELALDRLRIVRQALPWAELRTTFAERLRPIGAPEIAPPKRPR